MYNVVCHQPDFPVGSKHRRHLHLKNQKDSMSLFRLEQSCKEHSMQINNNELEKLLKPSN